MMFITIRLVTCLLAAYMCVSLSLTNEIHVVTPIIEIVTEEELAKILEPYVENEEYIRQIHLMINAFNTRKGEMMASRMEIETNDFINSKFKTGKRNVDLINSILALPKGMNDAGR